MDETPSAKLANQTKRELSAAEKASDEIRTLQADIHRRAAEGVLDILRWSEIELLTPEGDLNNAPPPEWVAEWGEEVAMRKFRIARAAAMRSSEAPAGLKLMVDMFKGAAAASADVGDKNLNVMVVKVYDVDTPESIIVKTVE